MCICDCGASKVISATNLVHQITVSCGCRGAEVGAENKKHGMRHSKEYEAWKKMRARCQKPYSNGYKHYGARGIIVCQEWDQDFSAFFADVGPAPSATHSIERKDVNGNYEPGNVVWATAKEQQRNKRNTRWIELNGERKSLAEWCELHGANYDVVQTRLDRWSWPIERALTEPSRRRQK